MFVESHLFYLLLIWSVDDFIYNQTLYNSMRLVTLVVVVALMAAAAAATAANDPPIVDTEGGRVSGIIEETLKGREFNSFYGIPFAQPPVGDLRFKVTQNLFREQY